MSEGVQILITERGGQLVAQRFDQLEQRLGKMGATGKHTGGILRSVLTKDIGILTGAAGKLSAILGGIGLAKVAKDTLDWSAKLADLQVEARISTTEIKAIEQQVLATAKATGTMSDELLASLLKFQTYGGILDKGKQSLGDIVDMHKATGASMEDLTSIAAVLFKTMRLGPEEAKKAFAEMRAMSIAGTITVKGQAETLPGLLALTGAYGYKGLRGVRQMAGIQQVLGEASGGNAAETSTMVQALFRSLTHFQGGLRKAGVEVYANKKTGEFKDIGDIMIQIFKNKRIMQTPGVLGKLFPREALRGAAALRTQFDEKAGTWRAGSNMDTVFAAAGSAQWKDVQSDVARRKGGPGAASSKVNKARAQFDAFLKGTGLEVAGAVMDNPGTAAALLGGGYLGIKSAPWLAKKLLGGGKGAGGIGGALGAAGGATPVFVTNMPGGGIPGAPGATGPGAGGKPGMTLLGAGAGLAVGVGAGLAINAAIEHAHPGAEAARDKLSEKWRRGVGGEKWEAAVDADKKRAQDQRDRLAGAGIPAEVIRAFGRLPGVLDALEKTLGKKGLVTVSAKGGLDKVQVETGRGRR